MDVNTHDDQKLAEAMDSDFGTMEELEDISAAGWISDFKAAVRRTWGDSIANLIPV